MGNQMEAVGEQSLHHIRRIWSTEESAGAPVTEMFQQNSGGALKEPVDPEEARRDLGAPENMLKRRESSCVPESL